MKKVVFILLIGVLLMAPLTSCEKPAKSLTACGLNVISLMDEMAKSEEYLSLYTIPGASYQDAYAEILGRLREGNYATPIAVYDLSIPDETLFEALELRIDRQSLSQDLYRYVRSSAYASIASYINGRSGPNGSAAMTLSSVLAVQKQFANGNADENKIYLYVYEKGYPVTVSFDPCENGAFRAYGHFIISDAFVTDDEQSIKESCEALGLAGVTVERR